MIQQHQQAAAASITSLSASAVGTFTFVNEVAQFIAALVAIVSGLTAIYYYIRKAHQK